MEVIKQWPPITRVLVVSTVALSVLIHAHIISHIPWLFYPPYVFRFPPEIWRVFTSFCITGGGLGILFDSYFLYTYSSGLERGSPRFTEHGSYFIYIVFVMGIVTALGGYVLGGTMLLQCLILAMAYTFSQDNPDSNVTIFILTFPAKYLPYALLFITLVSSGPDPAKVQLSGLIAAHLYDFLTRIWPTFGGGSNWLPTPIFVKRWFTPEGSQVQERSYGTAVNPRQNVPPNNNWSNQRGPGRRLGD